MGYTVNPNHLIFGEEGYLTYPPFEQELAAADAAAEDNESGYESETSQTAPNAQSLPASTTAPNAQPLLPASQRVYPENPSPVSDLYGYSDDESFKPESDDESKPENAPDLEPNHSPEPDLYGCSDDESKPAPDLEPNKNDNSEPSAEGVSRGIKRELSEISSSEDNDNKRPRLAEDEDKNKQEKVDTNMDDNNSLDENNKEQPNKYDNTDENKEQNKDDESTGENNEEDTTNNGRQSPLDYVLEKQQSEMPDIFESDGGE